jgi:hypothetical protein
LKKAEEEDELFEVRQILEKNMIAGKQHYKVWYYNELKKEANWQPETELLKFVPDLVKYFNEKPKPKPKKKKNKYLFSFFQCINPDVFSSE